MSIIYLAFPLYLHCCFPPRACRLFEPIFSRLLRPSADDKHRDPAFIPPKKPYSLPLILRDILHFASETVVDSGRLSFWMPTANDEDQELPLPAHPCFELVVVCVQPFNKWSRRLITYRKLADREVNRLELEAWVLAGAEEMARLGALDVASRDADALNPFRKGYFSKFQKQTTS